MYTSYWNLNHRPFQNHPDLRFAYLSAQHKEALARLLYLAEGRKLGGILIGPYGVGKSMVLSLLVEKIREMGTSHAIQLDTPVGGVMALAKQLLFKLNYHQPVSDIAGALSAVETICGEKSAVFPHLTLILDEAQLIRDRDSVEFLHLLTNMRILKKDGSYGETAITVILSGHGDVLKAVIQDVSFCQRLQLVYKLTPLTAQQVMEYVHSRIRSAGGDIWCFEETVFSMLHEASHGLPRIVNNICDVALVLGYSVGARRINQDIMRQAIEEVYIPAFSQLAPEGEKNV